MNRVCLVQLVAGHRVVVLQTIELVVKSKLEDISYPKIKTTISLASDEMTRSKVINSSRTAPQYILVLNLQNDDGIFVLLSLQNLSFVSSLQEVVPDWQQTASNILVAVGNKYISEIMEDILGKFQPGVLPHYFVIQTLASLSDSNGTYSYIKSNNVVCTCLN